MHVRAKLGKKLYVRAKLGENCMILEKCCKGKTHINGYRYKGRTKS